MASGQVVELQTPRRLSNFFPSHNGMSFTVFCVREKFKIFKSIVESVSISMVNILASCKFPLKMLFHDKSMFGYISGFTILNNSKKSISIYSNCAKTLLSTKRNVWVSPSFHLCVMTIAKSFCGKKIVAVFNGAVSYWKKSAFVIARLRAIFYDFSSSVKVLFTSSAFGYHSIVTLS